MTVSKDSASKTIFVTLATLACAFGLLVLCLRLQPKEGRIDDFVQEWTSARNHLAGRPVYEDLRISVAREFGPKRAAVLPNRYNGHPPVGILPALPFGSLNYRTAHFVWNLVSLAALLGALWLMLGRWGLKLPAPSWAYVGAVLLYSTPLARQVAAGQPNLLLLLFITAGWAAMRRDRDALAGCFLATASAIKLFPAFLFLYPLVLGRRRVIVAGGITFLALNGVAAVVLGTDAFRDFAALVLPDLSLSQDWWLNFSLTGYFRKMLYVTSGHSVPVWQNPALCYAFIGVGSLGATFAAGWKIRRCARTASSESLAVPRLGDNTGGRDPAVDPDVGFAVCLVANLLVSPITWDHYFILLVLPILIFWKATATTGGRAFLVTCALLLAINVQWIWDPMIAGDHELAYLWGGEPSVATALEAMTLLSYPFYTLVALLVFGLGIRTGLVSAKT